MKDKNGHEFSALEQIQAEHLVAWRSRLRGGFYADVYCYVVSANLPATDEKQVHRVYRGQDLVQIIMDWPDLKPCYVQPSKPEDPRADI